MSAVHVSALPARAIATARALDHRPARPARAPARRRRGRRARRPTACASATGRPGSAPSGRRRPRPRQAPVCRARSTGEAVCLRVYARLEQDVGSLRAGGHLGEKLLEQRGCPLAVARETVEVAARSTARACRAQDRRASGRRRARRARPLRRAPRGRPRARPPLPAPLRRPHRPVRGERQVAGPLLDVRNSAPPAPGEPHGASRPAPARSRSTRAGDARSGSASRPARRRPRARPPRAPRRTRSRSPCAAVTSSTRRPRERRDLSRTSSVSPGSRARRPPSSSRRLSGTGSAWPGVGPRVRADELAAELECEERVAGGRFLHSGELRPGQLEPEPLLEQAVKRAER